LERPFAIDPAVGIAQFLERTPMDRHGVITAPERLDTNLPFRFDRLVEMALDMDQRPQDPLLIYCSGDVFHGQFLAVNLLVPGIGFCC
jgi:hypothetical protein